MKMKHGTRHSRRLYDVYKAMKSRCVNTNAAYYHKYGGCGVTVCEEWLKNWHSFHDWALQNGYSKDLTIDRIDNNRGYGPDNCRWATRSEQANNKRNTIVISYMGVDNTITGWARDIGINRKTLYFRLTSGWDVKKMLTTPVKKGK